VTSVDQGSWAKYVNAESEMCRAHVSIEEWKI
jgi:hypothetical protein